MPKKLVKILSTDGGGMRGVIPAMIVAEIERMTGKPASQIFDLISGTSAGGILAMGLTAPKEDGTPKFSAADLVGIFEDDGKIIFSQSLWHRFRSVGNVVDAKYPNEGMVEVFDRHFGSIPISKALTEVLVASYELETGLPYFFKRTEARKDNFKDFSMKDVIMATSAAPTFFPPHIIDQEENRLVNHYVFVDGGIVAGNPAMCAYVEAKTLFPDAEEFLLVSLGTGQYSSKMLYELIKTWGVVQWIVPLISIFMNGSVDVVDHQLKTLLNTEGDKLNHYYRFQTRLDQEESPFDRADDMSVHILKILGENLIDDNRHHLEKLCQRLVAE